MTFTIPGDPSVFLNPPTPASLQIDKTLSYKRLISFGHQAGVLTRQFFKCKSNCGLLPQGNYIFFFFL